MAVPNQDLDPTVASMAHVIVADLVLAAGPTGYRHSDGRAIEELTLKELTEARQLDVRGPSIYRQRFYGMSTELQRWASLTMPEQPVMTDEQRIAFDEALRNAARGTVGVAALFIRQRLIAAHADLGPWPVGDLIAQREKLRARIDPNQLAPVKEVRPSNDFLELASSTYRDFLEGNAVVTISNLSRSSCPKLTSSSVGSRWRRTGKIVDDARVELDLLIGRLKDVSMSPPADTWGAQWSDTLSAETHAQTFSAPFVMAITQLEFHRDKLLSSGANRGTYAEAAVLVQKLGNPESLRKEMLQLIFKAVDSDAQSASRSNIEQDNNPDIDAVIRVLRQISNLAEVDLIIRRQHQCLDVFAQVASEDQDVATASSIKSPSARYAALQELVHDRSASLLTERTNLIELFPTPARGLSD